VVVFPPIDPYETGMLDVGDGQSLYWETSGNARGKPVLVLHGGPGSGSSPETRRLFDPAVFRVVQLDQRNCGRSLPHASDPSVELSANTTAHLVADCETLRRHLDIDRWMVFGASWGSTLALAYALGHPRRVTEMILASVVTTSHAEVEWVTRSMGRIFPEAWARFRDVLPPADRDGDLSAAYARLLESPDPTVRERAARAWCEWEDTHVRTDGRHGHDERFDDPRFRMCFARIVTHYWSRGAFLEDDALTREVHRLAGVPGVLITGRLDISAPPDVAWRLAHEWPGAELQVVEDVGHGISGPSMVEAIVRAARRFSGA
jgi:proline iminopeptidase